MNGQTLSVLLVEDDAFVRSWLEFALSGSEFRVAGNAASVAEAVELVERRRPDVLLVDYRLTDGTGTDLVRRLRKRGVAAPALLISATRREGLNEAAREAGAQGTALKTQGSGELLAALRSIAAGSTLFDPRHPRRPAYRATLSPREREALALVARGATNHEIAADLGVGAETVKTLLARTFTKLGVRKRAEAVSVAHARDLL